jgi:decaprenylphospho-beta-D-erythro-pentofuranosid-2-ulose 2-reductase
MKVLIIGASSALAYETAKCFARDGADLFLIARSASKMAAIADDLKARGAKSVETSLLDVSELERHQEVLEQAFSTLGRVDMLLIAHGTLGDQHKCELSVAETLQELNTNFTSVVSLLTISANYFEQQKQGCIAVISSVAGERGRRSNYVYGTAKAGVSTFLEGLRGRMAHAGVAVLTIKPGVVATPMTAGMRKGLLTANSRAVGQGIYQAMLKRKDVVYLPWFWRPIMLIVKSIPEVIFKKLSF